MSRHRNGPPMNRSLQRQFSMKSDEGNTPENNCDFSNMRISQPTSPNIITTSIDGRHVLDQKGIHSPNLDKAANRPISLRGDPSPKYLTVLDQNSSGYSSNNAMNRVSQQPSFESYDSSMSNNSWGSSQEPESDWTRRGGNQSPVMMSSVPTDLSNSRHPRQEEARKSKHGEKFARQHKFPAALKFEQTYPDPIVVRQNTADISPYIDQSHRASHQSMSIESAEGNAMVASTTSESTRDEKRARQYIHRIGGLKLIGSDKSSSVDCHDNAGTSSPKIKGLWKRAFQSFRKTKPDVSPPKPKESASIEIDPVYHLLRCAANKSQGTIVPLSGLNSQTTSTESARPSNLNSYAQGAKKKNKPPESALSTCR